ELAGVYALATVVFVGGSLMPSGGHNILEAAVAGKPVVVGPHMENFQEIADEFQGEGALSVVLSAEELAREVAGLLVEPARRAALAGGSGKTPVVALLAAMLRDAGRPVAVLSRGYRGSFRGDCLVVADAEGVHAGPEAAGDEPVMLARSLPGVVVAVGRRRDRVGRAVEARYGQRV